jgi:SAM-dependent methyltransferase
MPLVISPHSPAEIYDQKFVPALFAQWGPVVAQAAQVGTGMKVLDVGCGTGALALAALDLVGAGGEVIGVDPNPEMLAVASSKSALVRWVHGRAENLPFGDEEFDAVVSQFAAMFFEDRATALCEMQRIVRPGRYVAVAVCGDVDKSPGYSRFAALLDRLFGRDIGEAFRAPFVLGRDNVLREIAGTAGIERASIQRATGTVRFRSIADLVSTERACAWTLGGLLNQDQFEHLLREAETELAAWTTVEGRIEFDMPALILSFRRR